MILKRFAPAIRTRVLILVALGLAALVLIGVSLDLDDNPVPPVEPESTVRSAAPSTGFEEDLASVCAQFGIPEKAIRARKVSDRADHLLRKEYRIRVPKDFSSFEFNNALNRRVEQSGARVMGTEQTRDRTVTLHVLQGDKTVMSVILEHRD